MADAASKQAIHASSNAFVNEMTNGGGQMTDKSAKAYFKEFSKVIEAADVVLQICDARDPMGTRCKQVEEAVTNNASRGIVARFHAYSFLRLSSVPQKLEIP